MMNRLLQYLILLPIIALIAFTSIPAVLSYAWIIWVPVMAACLGYALYKTKKAQAKKILIIFAIGLSLLSGPLFAQVAGTDGAYTSEENSGITYTAENLAEELFEEKPTQEELKIFSTVVECDLNPPRSTDRARLEKCDKAALDFQEMMREQNKGKDVGTKSKCDTPQQLLKNIQKSCWTCDMVALIMETIDKVATTFHTKMQTGRYGLAILGIALAFWLLFKVAAMFMRVRMIDLGKFWTEVFKQILYAIFAAVLLMIPSSGLIDLLITPLFTFTAEYTVLIKDVSAFGSPNSLDRALTRTLNPRASTDCDYCVAMRNPEAPVAGQDRIDQVVYQNVRGPDRVSEYRASIQNRSFSPQIRNSVLCLACSMYQVISPPLIIGQMITCYAGNDGAVTFPPRGLGWALGGSIVFPHLGMLLVGVLLIIIFFCLIVIFPFYLIDAFFKIGFVVTLLPFYIIAATFKSTRPYAKSAWDLFIHSLFTFIVMATLLVIIVTLFYASLASDTTQITNALATNNIKALYNLFGFKSGFLSLLMAGALLFFSISLMETTNEIVEDLTGISYEAISGSDILNAMTKAVQAPINVIKEGTKPEGEDSKEKGGKEDKKDKS